MNKILSFFVMLALALTLTACGGGAGESSVESDIKLVYRSTDTSLLNIEWDELFTDILAYGDFYRDSTSLVEKLQKNDEIMRALQIYLAERTDQSFSFTHQRITIDGETGEYLVLRLYDQSSANSRTSLNRLAENVNVKAVYIDLVSTSEKNAGGYFKAESGELYLAEDYIISTFIFGDIGGVARHELAHAMFEKMRKNGTDSIYHSSFISASEYPLGYYGTGYDHFISAEELYNYVSNMYWVLKVDEDVLSNENYRQFFLSQLEQRIEQLSGVAYQLRDLSEEVIDEIEADRTTYRLTNNMFVEPNNSKVYYYSFGSKYVSTYSKAFSAVTRTSDVIFKYIESLAKDGYAVQSFHPNAFPSHAKSTAQNLFDQLARSEQLVQKELIDEMRKLNNVASFFEVETKKLKNSFRQLKERVSNGESDVEVKAALVDFRKELRTFINKSREWHPSFAGVLD